MVLGILRIVDVYSAKITSGFNTRVFPETILLRTGQLMEINSFFNHFSILYEFRIWNVHVSNACRGDYNAVPLYAL